MRTRIGILGMGGVGGYFGGLLAKAYFESDTIEIVFIARGETQKAIARNGLKIIDGTNEMIVFPTLVSNNPDEIGKLDYLICATKTYDIETSLGSIKKCISATTIILPLYNGVDATGRIETLFPENTILQGCVYIVSMIESPGIIKKIGFYEKLFFGSKTAPISKLKELQSIFENADIESYLVENIEETVVREVKEETGINVDSLKYLGSDYVHEKELLMITFMAKYVSGEITPSLEVEWAEWCVIEDAINEMSEDKIGINIVKKVIKELKKPLTLKMKSGVIK